MTAIVQCAGSPRRVSHEQQCRENTLDNILNDPPSTRNEDERAYPCDERPNDHELTRPMGHNYGRPSHISYLNVEGRRGTLRDHVPRRARSLDEGNIPLKATASQVPQPLISFAAVTTRTHIPLPSARTTPGAPILQPTLAAG